MTGRLDQTSDSARGHRSRLPLVAYVLALGTFLMLTTEFVVAGLLPDIAADVGVSVGSSGLLITVFAVGMVVGSPSMALLTLRLPHRRTLVLALFVFAAGHATVAVATHFPLMLVARFLTAIAAGAFWTVSAVVATRASPAHMMGRALALVNAGGTLATVLGVPAGAFIAQFVGWRGTFWALAGGVIVVMVVVARHVPSAPVALEAAPPTGVRDELRSLRSYRLWVALCACVCTNGGVLAAYSFIAPFLTDRANYAASDIPVLLTVFGVGSFVGGLLGGQLGDRWPHATTVVVPAVTTTLLVLLAVVATGPLSAAVLVGLLGLFGLSANPVLGALILRYAGRAPTLGSSLTVAGFNLGTAFSSWVAGLTLTTGLGSRGPVVLGAALAGTTLVPVVLLAVRRHRSSGSAA